MAYVKNYNEELIDYPAASSGASVSGRPRKAYYNRPYTNAASPFTAVYTDPLLVLDTAFTFSLVAGTLPPDLVFYSSGIITGTPVWVQWPPEAVVHECSYPVYESTINRFYFVVGARGVTHPNYYGEAVFYLDTQKNWCHIRDEFTQKVQNQSFAVDNVQVTNQEYLDSRKSSGDYFCP